MIFVNYAFFNCSNIKIFTQRSLAQNYNLSKEIQDRKSDSTLNHVAIRQITIKSVSVGSWSYVHKDSFAF